MAKKYYKNITGRLFRYQIAPYKYASIEPNGIHLLDVAEASKHPLYLVEVVNKKEENVVLKEAPLAVADVVTEELQEVTQEENVELVEEVEAVAPKKKKTTKKSKGKKAKRKKS